MADKQSIKMADCIRLPFQFSKKDSWLLLLSGIFYGLIFNLATFFLSQTINKLTEATMDIKSIIISVVIYLLSMGVMFFINNFQTYFEKNLMSRAYIKAKKALYTQKYKMKYILNEDQEILNTFNLLGDIENNIVDYIKSIVFFITLFCQLTFLFILISFYSVYTALCMLGISAIIIGIVIKGGNISYIANKKAQPLEREKNSIKNILVDFSYAEERNLFGYGEKLSDRYKKKAKESRKYANKALFIWFAKAQYGGIIFILLTVIITFLLSVSLINKEISLGLFVALFSTFVQLSDLMSWNLSDNVDSFIKSLSKVKDYIWFLKLEEEQEDKRGYLDTNETIKEIQFNDVSFTYPNSEKVILNNMNLKFEIGKKYAIVGENGCGKTTIFKLLLGLYTSYNGNIYFNNKEIKREIFLNEACVVFQDFTNYFIPIQDFLQLGTERILTYDEIIEVFRSLNLELNLDNLPLGLSTPLGNILEQGTNISGGQWQKLCLARAILSKKSILILDEPTAAIDPISELEIMNTFKKLCKNKTIIHITHRLSSIKDVDVIYVIHNGKVVEEGSHNYLMGQRGLYEKMFELQKSWYQDELGGENLER